MKSAEQYDERACRPCQRQGRKVACGGKAERKREQHTKRGRDDGDLQAFEHPVVEEFELIGSEIRGKHSRNEACSVGKTSHEALSVDVENRAGVGNVERHRDAGDACWPTRRECDARRGGRGMLGGGGTVSHALRSSVAVSSLEPALTAVNLQQARVFEGPWRSIEHKLASRHADDAIGEPSS